MTLYVEDDSTYKLDYVNVKQSDGELEPLKELFKTDSMEESDQQYARQYTQGIVPETDDPSAPSLSIRMIFLGTIWAVFLGLVNGGFAD